MNFAEDSQEQVRFAENYIMDLTTGKYSDHMTESILQMDLSGILFSIVVQHWTVSSHSNWNRMLVEAEEEVAL